MKSSFVILFSAVAVQLFCYSLAGVLRDSELEEQALFETEVDTTGWPTEENETVDEHTPVESLADTEEQEKRNPSNEDPEIIRFAESPDQDSNEYNSDNAEEHDRLVRSPNKTSEESTESNEKSKKSKNSSNDTSEEATTAPRQI